MPRRGKQFKNSVLSFFPSSSSGAGEESMSTQGRSAKPAKGKCPHIPQEIVLEILSRLPVKSLLRFTCVSKSWNSLITSPSFVAAHLRRNIRSEDRSFLLFLRHYSDTDPRVRNTLCMDGESSTQHGPIDLPLGSSETYHYVGSCNGLLCFADCVVNKMVLWNPAIRKYLQLPVPRVVGTTTLTQARAALGFDDKRGEYKLLRLIYNWSTKLPRALSMEAEIYELRTNTWRSMDTTCPPYPIRESSTRVFLDGAAHWISSRLSEDGVPGTRPVLVVAFDFHEERFREMEIPVGVWFGHELELSLTVYEDLLCLFQCNPWVPDGHELHGVCVVWAMKEYGIFESWTKLFSIDMHERGGILRVLGFRKHGEVLLMRDNELVSYDSKSRKLNHLHLGVYGIIRSSEVVAYVESLTLLKDN